METAPVERKTTQKICDEFKVPDRMIEATKECMKVCKVDGEGCDDDEKAYEDFSDYEKRAEKEVTERGGIYESLKANAGSQPFELRFYYKHSEYRMEVSSTNVTTHRRDHAGGFYE